MFRRDGAVLEPNIGVLAGLEQRLVDLATDARMGVLPVVVILLALQSASPVL